MVHHVDRAMRLLAQRQYGTFGDRQARAHGASREFISRRIASEDWTREAEGALSFPDWPESFERTLWLGLHSAQTSALIGGWSAGSISELTGFPRGRAEILVPHGSRHDNPFALVRQTRRMPPKVIVAGFPSPPLERVVCDGAALMGVKRLGTAVDDLLLQRRTTIPKLERAFLEVASPGMPGFAVMVEVLALRGHGYVVPRSELERELELLKDLIPGAEWRREVYLGDQTEFPHQVDLVTDVPAKLIVEADGRSWHARVKDMRKDRQRDRRAARLGYPTFRYTYEDIVHDGAETRREIREYLGL